MRLIPLCSTAILMSVGMLWLWNKKCKHNVGKLADDPTKVTTKLGLS